VSVPAPRRAVRCCDILRALGFKTVQADLPGVGTGAAGQRRALRSRGDEPAVCGQSGAAAPGGRRRARRRGGRLVAILPASLRGKDLLKGFAPTWSQPYPDEFPGTSVSVVVLTADRQA